MNKYARPVEENKVIQFHYQWVGERVPSFIILPFDKKVKVTNMRSGKIILENGDMGTYKRYKDNNTSQERAIIIELEIS